MPGLPGCVATGRTRADVKGADPLRHSAYRDGFGFDRRSDQPPVFATDRVKESPFDIHCCPKLRGLPIGRPELGVALWDVRGLMSLLISGSCHATSG